MMSRLAVAFFATGFAALLCQIVWQRMLGIFAGSDTISAALVVGAFLAGLGLGSIIGAKVADRLTPARALVGFALAEIGVGVFALLSKLFLYDWLATDLAGRGRCDAGDLRAVLRRAGAADHADGRLPAAAGARGRDHRARTSPSASARSTG